MPTDYQAQFSDFQSLPQVPEYMKWLESKHGDKAAAKRWAQMVEKVWLACWKKPLEAITEQDIVTALNWIKENHPNSVFQWILGIRSMVRFGIGNQAWLSKNLGTKGKKNQPRTLAILTQSEFFDKTLPAIFEKIKTLPAPEREREEMNLAVGVKVASGIRTGDHKKERELWGTRINEGKTNLQISVEGSISDWIVFAKKGEIWHVRYMPQRLRTELIAFIRKYKLKNGDYLMQALSIENARKYLKDICESLGIPPLRLHDLRKVYLTGLCLAGIPLETAVDLNVGWKDLNTAKKHYLEIRAMNADKEYDKFSERFFK
jgi:integrase